MTPQDLARKMRKPTECDRTILDRIQGSMVGMALGDAAGAHVEFRPYDFIKAHPVTELKGGGTWGLKTGQVLLFCTNICIVLQQYFKNFQREFRSPSNLQV